jgi:hypothetical protein
MLKLVFMKIITAITNQFLQLKKIINAINLSFIKYILKTSIHNYFKSSKKS